MILGGIARCLQQEKIIPKSNDLPSQSLLAMLGGKIRWSRLTFFSRSCSTAALASSIFFLSLSRRRFSPSYFQKINQIRSNRKLFVCVPALIKYLTTPQTVKWDHYYTVKIVTSSSRFFFFFFFLINPSIPQGKWINQSIMNLSALVKYLISSQILNYGRCYTNWLSISLASSFRFLVKLGCNKLRIDGNIAEWASHLSELIWCGLSLLYIPGGWWWVFPGTTWVDPNSINSCTRYSKVVLYICGQPKTWIKSISLI